MAREGGWWRCDEEGNDGSLAGVEDGRGCDAKIGLRFGAGGRDRTVGHIFARFRRIGNESFIPESCKTDRGSPPRRTRACGGKAVVQSRGTNTSISPKGDSRILGLLARCWGYTGEREAGRRWETSPLGVISLLVRGLRMSDYSRNPSSPCYWAYK